MVASDVATRFGDDSAMVISSASAGAAQKSVRHETNRPFRMTFSLVTQVEIVSFLAFKRLCGCNLGAERSKIDFARFEESGVGISSDILHDKHSQVDDDKDTSDQKSEHQFRCENRLFRIERSDDSQSLCDEKYDRQCEEYIANYRCHICKLWKEYDCNCHQRRC